MRLGSRSRAANSLNPSAHRTRSSGEQEAPDSGHRWGQRRIGHSAESASHEPWRPAAPSCTYRRGRDLASLPVHLQSSRYTVRYGVRMTWTRAKWAPVIRSRLRIRPLLGFQEPIPSGDVTSKSMRMRFSCPIGHPASASPLRRCSGDAAVQQSASGAAMLWGGDSERCVQVMKANHDHDIVNGHCRLCGWDGSERVRQRPTSREGLTVARADRAKRARRRRRGKVKYKDRPET